MNLCLFPYIKNQVNNADMQVTMPYDINKKLKFFTMWFHQK